MAVSSGFFNSIDGDRTYNADQMSTYFKGLISDGVYENVGSRLRVTNGNGMSINVGTGRAVVLSRWVENDAELNLTLDAADVQYNRIDAIAVQLDLTEGGRAVNIVVKKGTNATSPEPPARSTGADIYELYLATVSIPKGTTAITQDLITDLRPSDQCGWVTGLVEQVDTSDLYAQWAAAYAAYYAQSTALFNAYLAAKQAEFETWFEHLTEQLNVDTTLREYQNTVTVSGTTSAVTIGIEDYDPDADLLSAYSNGILLVNGIDYTIAGTGATAQIRLVNSLTGTNDITFVVIKSVIGEGGGGFPTLDDYITANVRSRALNASAMPQIYLVDKTNNKIYGTCGSNVGLLELNSGTTLGWAIENGALTTEYRIRWLSDSNNPIMFGFNNGGDLPYCDDASAYNSFNITNPQNYKAHTIGTVSAPVALEFLEDEGTHDFPEKLPVTLAFKMQLASTDNVFVIKLNNRTVPHLVRLLNGAVATITKSGNEYTINIPSSAHWHYPEFYSSTVMTSSSGLSNGREGFYTEIGPVDRGYFDFLQNNALLTFDLIYNGEVLTHANATIDDFLWE